MSGYKILKFRATSGFGKWQKYFPEEAITHPAKINLHLLEYLIQNYTEEGDTILDPMCGTGSTVVLSMLNNRNAIGVELEEKFTGWAKQAIENVEREQILTPKGKGVVICGDSRKLSELLKEHEEEISSVLFSPPYASSFKSNPQNREKRIERLRKVDEAGVESGVKWGLCSDEALERLADRQDLGYGDGEGNVGNLPFVDGVIFSPPYTATRHNYKHGLKELGDNFKGRKAWEDKEKVKTSEDNIENLPFMVDCVLASPPYAQSSSPFVRGAPLEDGDGLPIIGCLNIQGGYSGSWRNIGNLPFIAAMIFSPPYYSSISAETDADKRLERLEKKGYLDSKEWQRPNTIKTLGRNAMFSENIYSAKDNGNIGNIKEFGVDAVVTSPPYEKTVKDHGKSDRATKINVEKSNHSSFAYSGDENNIGNQKKESYLEAMKPVYAECHKILKPQGLLVLILKNFVRDKKVVSLTDHTIKLCEGVGFKLKERLLFKLPTQSFWRRLYSQKYPEVDTADLRYEHILIFEKV